MASITLTINGQPSPCPATYPQPDPPSAGDLIDVGFFSIILQSGDAQRAWRLDRAGYGASLFADDAPVAVPSAALAGLTAAQRGRLRGVILLSWSPEIATLLDDTDPERCVYWIVGCFEEHHEPDSSGKVTVIRRLPPLPERCRHLLVRTTSSGGGIQHDWSDLARLTLLQTLTLPAFLSDLSVVRRMPGLRDLAARYCRADSLQPLAALRALRRLDLRNSSLTDLGPLSALTRLEALSLSFSQGRVSLAPLADLPGLRWLDVNVSDADRLPAAGWASLARLECLSSLLPADHIAAFQSAHPGCVVHACWTRRFQQATRGADRLRVRTGGTCHREPEQEQTLAVLGAAGAAAFIEALRITPGPGAAEVDRWVAHWRKRYDGDRQGETLSEAGQQAARRDRRLRGVAEPVDLAALRAAWARYLLRGARCRCCGHPTVELYAGEQLLASVGFHHGQSVRWDGWPVDADLQPGVAERLGALVPGVPLV